MRRKRRNWRFTCDDVRVALGSSSAEAPQAVKHKYDTRPSYSAAVALILRDRGEGLEMMFAVRALNEDDRWSGHVCFPGGRAAEFDRSSKATAERETFEETGLDLGTQARYLGIVPTGASVQVGGKGRPKLSIDCHVYQLIDAGAKYELAPSEISRIGWVHLDDLVCGKAWTAAAHESWKYSPIKSPALGAVLRVLWLGGIEMPALRLQPVEIFPDDASRVEHVPLLWGLTLKMFLEFVQCLGLRTIGGKKPTEALRIHLSNPLANASLRLVRRVSCLAANENDLDIGTLLSRTAAFHLIVASAAIFHITRGLASRL